MADIRTPQNWLVTPNADVEQIWKETQIQEKKSRIRALELRKQVLEQQIEDIRKKEMRLVDADLIMLRREVQFLEAKKVKAEVQ